MQEQPALSVTQPRTGVCVVTGGAGFIGCALSAALAAAFETVVAIDVLHPQVHRHRIRPTALHQGVDLMVGDVTDSAAWDGLLRRLRPDVVVHLAAETGTGQSLSESDRHGRVNVCGTTTMLDAFSRASLAPARIVLASSRAVYGEGAWRDVGGVMNYPRIRDKTMLSRALWDFKGLVAVPCSAAVTWPRPCSVYGATKLAQEHILDAWCAANQSELSVLRLQNVYGPGQSLVNSYTGIVSLFCRLARDGKSIPIYEDGAMLRDFVAIDDVARALALAATGAAPSGIPLDIGTGRAVPIGLIAGMIARRYNAAAPHVTGQYRFGDVRHAACDIGPTLRALPGWAPEVPVETGLERLIVWIEAELETQAA